MRTLRRWRAAVSVVFLLYGTMLGAWTSRIPAIKQRLGLSDGQLSVGLLAFAAGAVLGMQLAGRLVDRYGSARVIVPAALLDAVLLVAPAGAVNLPVLAVALLAFGAAHGTLNVAMNANALEVQRAAGRAIISSFHAIYSVGGFLGAAAGGLFASAGLGAGATFGAVSGTVVVATLVAGRSIVSDPPPDRTDQAATAPGGRLGRVTFLGALIFCCLVGEGAAADWSGVYLRDDLGSSPGLAAAAYATFSACMLAGRLVADGLVARVGPVRLVRWSAVLAAVGLAAAVAVDRQAAGLVGFGLLGAGLSGIAPQVFSTAGNLDPARAGQALARVTGLGFLGFAVGPVLIGVAASLVGLPVALLIPAVLALFVAAAAPVLRPPRDRSDDPAGGPPPVPGSVPE
jgi:predicted MFS family arabinose efflux permease